MNTQLLTLEVINPEDNLHIHYFVPKRAKDLKGKEIPHQLNDYIEVTTYLATKLDFSVEQMYALLPEIFSNVHSRSLNSYIIGNTYNHTSIRNILNGVDDAYYVQIPKDMYYHLLDVTIEWIKYEMTVERSLFWWEVQKNTHASDVRVKPLPLSRKERLFTGHDGVVQVTVEGTEYTFDYSVSHEVRLRENLEELVYDDDEGDSCYWIDTDGEDHELSDKEVIAYLAASEHLKWHETEEILQSIK